MSTSPDDRVSQNPLSRKMPEAGREPAGLEPLPKLSRLGDGEGLSSLAQAARQKQLKTARWTLIVVGVLSVIAYSFILYSYGNMMDAELRKAGLDPRNPPPIVQDAMKLDYAINGAFLSVGVLFIGLGIMVYKMPVACTVIGLVLYVLCWLAAITIDPTNVGKGIVLKIMIVAILFKAVQAAMAYQRDEALTPEEIS